MKYILFIILILVCCTTEAQTYVKGSGKYFHIIYKPKDAPDSGWLNIGVDSLIRVADSAKAIEGLESIKGKCRCFTLNKKQLISALLEMNGYKWAKWPD